MVSKRISELPAAGALDGTEQIPLTQDGETRRIPSDTYRQLHSLADAQVEGAVGDGSTDDSAALSGITADGIILPPGTYKVSSSFTWNGKHVYFEAGAKLSPDSGVTVTLDRDCIVEAGDTQAIFFGAGDVVYETHGRVSANWWGLDTGNDYARRINACQANARNARFYDHYEVGEIIGRPCNFTRGTDLNGKNKKPYFRWYGYFVFNVATGEECVLDYTSCRWPRTVGLRLDRQSETAFPKTGILHSRDGGGESISNAHWIDSQISGRFEIAAFMAHGAELDNFDDCRFDNVMTAADGSTYTTSTDYPAGKPAAGMLHTSNNDLGVTSPHTTVLGNTNISNTGHSMDNTTLESRGVSGPLMLEGSERWDANEQNYLNAGGDCESFLIVDSTKSACQYMDFKLYGEGVTTAKAPRGVILRGPGGLFALSRLVYVAIGSATGDATYPVLVQPEDAMALAGADIRVLNQGVEFDGQSAWSLKGVHVEGSAVKLDTGVAADTVVGTIVADSFPNIVGVQNGWPVVLLSRGGGYRIGNTWQMHSTGAWAPVADGGSDIGTTGRRVDDMRANNVRTTALYPNEAGVFTTSGSGDPEGVVSAPVGSTYQRDDGGAGTTLYVKESGTGNTGWVAK